MAILYWGNVGRRVDWPVKKGEITLYVEVPTSFCEWGVAND
jgi:hypothetical protein